MEKLTIGCNLSSLKKSTFLCSFVEHLKKTYEVSLEEATYGTTVLHTPKTITKKWWVSWLSQASIAYTEIAENYNQALYWLLEDGVVQQRNKIGGKLVYKEITSPLDLEDGGVYRRVYPESTEYRAHVCNGKVVVLYVKNRNEVGEVKYSVKVGKIDKKWLTQVIYKIGKGFLFSLYAIDFIYDQASQQFRIVDILLNPKASEKTLDKYIKAFVRKKKPVTDEASAVGCAPPASPKLFNFCTNKDTAKKATKNGLGLIAPQWLVMDDISTSLLSDECWPQAQSDSNPQSDQDIEGIF